MTRVILSRSLTSQKCPTEWWICLCHPIFAREVGATARQRVVNSHDLSVGAVRIAHVIEEAFPASRYEIFRWGHHHQMTQRCGSHDVIINKGHRGSRNPTSLGWSGNIRVPNEVAGPYRVQVLRTREEVEALREFWILAARVGMPIWTSTFLSSIFPPNLCVLM